MCSSSRPIPTIGEVAQRSRAGLKSASLPDPGSPARLAAYERARRADILSRTAAVDALNRTLLTGFLPVQALRGVGLFLLDRVPSLRQAVMRQGIARPVGASRSVERVRW